MNRKVEKVVPELIVHDPGLNIEGKSGNYDFCTPDILTLFTKDNVEVVNKLLDISHAKRIVVLTRSPEEAALIQRMGQYLDLKKGTDFQARIAEVRGKIIETASEIPEVSEVGIGCVDCRLQKKSESIYDSDANIIIQEKNIYFPELSSPKIVKNPGGHLLGHEKIVAELGGKSKLINFMGKEIPKFIRDQGYNINSFSNHATMGNPYDCGAVQEVIKEGFNIDGPRHLADLYVEAAYDWEKKYGNVVKNSPVNIYMLNTKGEVLGVLNLKDQKHFGIFAEQDQEAMHQIFADHKKNVDSQNNFLPN